MDVDDTDGAGPEIISMADPEDGLAYSIAVHYWNDNFFGPSVATVKVFVGEELIYEASSQPMKKQDLWEVGTITGSSGEFTPIDNYIIDYVNPMFFVP